MTVKYQENSSKIDYAQNLKRFLNVEDFDFKVLKKSFGMLRGTLKNTLKNSERDEEGVGKKNL